MLYRFKMTETCFFHSLLSYQCHYFKFPPPCKICPQSYKIHPYLESNNNNNKKKHKKTELVIPSVAGNTEVLLPPTSLMKLILVHYSFDTLSTVTL